MIRTFLADDEPIAIKRLTSIIKESCGHLTIIGTATTFEDAKRKITELNPELVFLDIEFGGRNSIDILESIKFRSFEVIFVTAHDRYGIMAVKNGALDYVLKPIDRIEFINAVEKATLKVYQNRVIGKTIYQTKALVNNITERLALPSMEGLVFVDVCNIIYCQSDGRYTKFYLAVNPKELLVSKNLGEYEAILPQNNFVRIHNHTIVNLNFVEKYLKGRGGFVVLSSGKQLQVSFRKKMDFFDKLT